MHAEGLCVNNYVRENYVRTTTMTIREYLNPAEFTMRAWPVARSIFDAERSERADNKLDKAECAVLQ